MKIEIPTTKIVDITHVRLELPVLYKDEDMPYDFPLRSGDDWMATVNIDTGKVVEWPTGQSGRVDMKVVDTGSYILLDVFGNEVAALKEEYVPDLIPGDFGDYVDLKINEEGIITNWPEDPDVSEFFDTDDVNQLRDA